MGHARQPKLITVAQAAEKFRLHPNTVRRFLRKGRLNGKKISGRSGGEWMILEKAEVLPPRPKGPAGLSYRELKQIYDFSLFLTRGVDGPHLREMIRRGFFSNGIMIHELDRVEAAAKGVLRDSGWEARDPELWDESKSIVAIGAKVPFKERHPELRTMDQYLADFSEERDGRSRRRSEVSAPAVGTDSMPAPISVQSDQKGKPIMAESITGSITGYGTQWVVKVPLGRDPGNGKRLAHSKSLQGTKGDAQAYIDWYAGLVATGTAPRETVSQCELRDLAALDRKAAAFRTKLRARIDAGARVEPGKLSL